MLLAAWSVPAAIGTVVFYVRQLQEGAPFSWTSTILFVAPFWYLWALLTPFVLGLGSRWPLDESGAWKSAPVHVFAALATGASHLFAALLIMRSVAPEPPPRSLLQAYRYFVGAYLEFEFLLYFTILGAGYLVHYYTRYRTNTLRTAQLEAQLAQAHLDALRVQLQPHFLFNTLHAISALMDEDLEQARRMLVRLGDLLRMTLETQGTHEVTLQQELECTELYLDIERVRFPEQLEVDLLVDPETLEALVPSLILQPLVENSIRYGVAPLEDGGKVTVSARREEGSLVLKVMDNGAGRSAREGKEGRTGMGIANVRARLTELYGRAQDFHVFYPESGGFGVQITLPFRVPSSPQPIPAAL
ncbi:MAG: sensor histidine kinase [Gemmatimonadota bacterium]